ncbi:6-O-methylguanine DNA methyltransferase [Blastocladiella britannica]|nr:6-O-methylguanine DNA methyltransferase [Blastocladiella britannica]
MPATPKTRTHSKPASNDTVSAPVIPANNDTDNREYPITAADRATAVQANGRPVTAFQFRVYDAILCIPQGHVTTYGELAKHLSSSPRAVGQALRVNPYAPGVPCHRVVATGGKLGGFFGHSKPGVVLGRKVQLLKDEGIEDVAVVQAWSAWPTAAASIEIENE